MVITIGIRVNLGFYIGWWARLRKRNPRKRIMWTNFLGVKNVKYKKPRNLRKEFRGQNVLKVGGF